MNILWTILIGLIAGALARFIVPGRESGGVLVSRSSSDRGRTRGDLPGKGARLVSAGGIRRAHRSDSRGDHRVGGLSPDQAISSARRLSAERSVLKSSGGAPTLDPRLHSRDIYGLEEAGGATWLVLEIRRRRVAGGKTRRPGLLPSRTLSPSARRSPAGVSAAHEALVRLGSSHRKARRRNGQSRGRMGTCPSLSDASCTWTWTRSTRRSSSATTRRSPESPSPSAAIPPGAASSARRATRRGRSACARPCRWRARSGSARTSSSSARISRSTARPRGRSSRSSAPSRRSSSRCRSTRRTST